MKDKFLTMLKSRRFLIAAAGVAVVVGQDMFGITLDTEQVVAVAGIVMAWILGDTFRKTV